MLFSGLVVKIEQFEVRIGEKGWHTYQVVRHPGGVGVLPLHDDGTVTLIRQLRPAVGGTLLEIPAGRLQPGEDPAACGGREMAEETGLSARELVPLGHFYPSPGVLDEVIHLFLGTGLSQGKPAAGALRGDRDGASADRGSASSRGNGGDPGREDDRGVAAVRNRRPVRSPPPSPTSSVAPPGYPRGRKTGGHATRVVSSSDAVDFPRRISRAWHGSTSTISS